MTPNVQDWSPHMSFILKGSQISIFSWIVSSNPRPQSKNIEMKYKNHIKLMHRIKNQSSNSTSCSDDALRLSVLVVGRLYWGLQVTSSFCNLGLRFEGLFWKRYIYSESPNRIWRLQSWTLMTPPASGLARPDPARRTRSERTPTPTGDTFLPP